MLLKRTLFSSVFVLVCFALLVIRSMPANEKESVKPIPTESKNEKIRRSMAQKLPETQKILQGMVMDDMDLVATAAAKLKKLSIEAPDDLEGDDIDNQLYDHFKLEFLRLTTQLEEMGRKKNPEGAAFAYRNLTSNCMACHKYLSGLQ